MSLSRTYARDYGEKSGTSFDPWIIVAFLYPLTQLIMVEFGGQLYLTDFSAVALLVFMVRSPDFMDRIRQLRPVLIFLGLWLLGQVATDIWRETASVDYLRGWAKIIFFGLQLTALWLFLPRRRVYLLAFGLGMGIAYFFTIPEEYLEYAWKFGRGHGLMLVSGVVLCLALPFVGSLRKYAPVIFIIIAFFLLLQNARSAFAISFIVAGIAGVALLLDKFPHLQKKLSPAVFAILLIGGIGAASSLSYVYGAVAESGMLGKQALMKYRAQSEGEIPLILGGRSESLISIVAIGDSPVLGHGSWARDRKYIEMYRTLRLRLGIYFPKGAYVERDLIPSHSYFFGAWVEAGVLGALFWAYIFTMPFMATYALLKRREPLMPLVAYCSTALLWYIPFSPFGATARFGTAFVIVTLLWMIKYARSEARKPIYPRYVQRRYAPAE